MRCCVCVRRQMPAMNGGEMTLEKTPSYFVTKSVPARVHNMSSDLRLIIVLRDPVTRAVSDYTQVSVSGVSNHTPLIVFSPSQLFTLLYYCSICCISTMSFSRLVSPVAKRGIYAMLLSMSVCLFVCSSVASEA